MVYPASEIIFKVDTTGRSGTPSWATIKDVETFDISFDNGIEEWNPYDAEGWVRRLTTSKSVTIGTSGKRNEGDIGNDYVASLAIVNGTAANTTLQITFPDGATLVVPCVANVSNIGGGDATAVSPLEAEFLSDGKPTYTAA